MDKLRGIGNSFSSFSSNKYLSGNVDFLESNSIVAKFGFLILILILFVVLMRVGVYLLGTIYSPSPNPILIDGMIDSRQFMKIPQNPSVNGAIPIIRSKNEDSGLVFTWSVWININDLQYREGEYKHIFHKGNSDINSKRHPTGMNYPNNAKTRQIISRNHPGYMCLCRVIS